MLQTILCEQDQLTKPGIICLQETNVTEKHIPELPIPKGWVAVFTKTPSGHMKGVSIMVEERLVPKRGVVHVIYDVSDDWMDVFVAWAPAKNLSLTAAYVDLGRIVPGFTGNRDQRGAYLSAQVAF